MKPPAAPGTSRVRTASWVLYDLANTVYAATVTFLFTPYAQQVLGGKLGGVGWAQFVSMAIAALLVPVCGAIADHTGRAHRYLTIATLLCIAAMAGIGLGLQGGWMLLCFAVANLTYNMGLLFYNALLPAVATPTRSGLVSGIGVGVGYVGTILVLATLLEWNVAEEVKILGAAAMFFVFALPCLLLVEAPPAERPAAPAARPVHDALRSLAATLRELPRNRPVLLFLVGNFCLADVLNTAVLFFAAFTKQTFAPASADGSLVLLGRTYLGDDGLQVFLRDMGLALNLLALVFGCALGAFTDRAPLRVMRISGLSLLGALVGGAWFAGRDALGYAATLVVLGAFGLAGIWTAGRKLVLLLAPPHRVGEYFGLYGITVKLSVIGSVLFAQVSDRWGSRTAMLAQSAQLLLGLACLYMLRIPARAGGPAKA